MKLLTLEDAAHATQLSEASIRRRCVSGEIAAAKIANQWRITPESLSEWVSANTRTKPEQSVRQSGTLQAESRRGSWRHLRPEATG